MNVRIDARFLKTYERHMETRQHIETWSATAPGDELIRSVHLFSNELIVVFHLGSLTPDTWTPERYPRLLLMHLAPLGPKVQKSFNYNKLRAMLISRVRVGVQLDSDQFVAPGADYMFNMTEREITREYPIPILPVHYFSFTQRDAPSNIWWRRFCPDPPKCELHSMRWREKGALRIADIPEDEDMLNVAAWEDKVTKQWCKFDNGAAKAHFTAHNAKDPKETARWIDRIHARYKKGLYPTKVIVYQGRLFSSGEELRKDEQSAFTPCQVQKPPKSNSYNSEGQRPRESWWRAASLDDLRREQGVRPSTSLCSKQAGTTGNSTGPEEAKAKALAEDHGPVLTSRPQRRTIAEPRGKANQESTEECRFFRDPPRQRSSAQNFWKELRGRAWKQREAGAASAHNRRFDTPAGTAALMGRARSQTPDYHRRYASNAVGSSLPGCQLTQAVALKRPRFLLRIA
eukprot:g26001.t1